MMAYSEDHIALAAEYALGTLDADERAQVETMMSVDKGFTAMVQAWEQKLGVLNQMVGSIEPRPEVWDKIRTAAGLSAPQEPLVLPQEAPPPSGRSPGCAGDDRAVQNRPGLQWRWHVCETPSQESQDGQVRIRHFAILRGDGSCG